MRGALKIILICGIIGSIIDTQALVHQQFSDCGSEVGEVTYVNVSSCDRMKPYCPLKRGTNVTISIGFKTKTDITEVKVQVHGIIQSLPIPFRVPEPDGCHDSGILCPLPANHTTLYTAVLPVLKMYPKIQLTVKWELLNEDTKDIACVLIVARIV